MRVGSYGEEGGKEDRVTEIRTTAMKIIEIQSYVRLLTSMKIIKIF